MGIRCPKCKGILNAHAKRCPEPDCGWSVVPENSKAYQEDGPETVKEREWATATREERLEIRFNEITQRLTAVELAIKAMQDTVDCPPACEQQPAAAEFTAEQMADAIDAAISVTDGRTVPWVQRALRAARDRLLATKRSG